MAEGLVKDYRPGIRALDGLSFSAAAGEIYGLLGPNGAGKTTTVRIVVALLAPSEGRVVVAGHDVSREADAVRSAVGYAAQASGVDIDLTVWENLVLRARLHALDRRAARSRAGAMIDRFGLTDVSDRRTGFLSGGQRRRLDLALALVHEPSVIVLDEPTTGLDPQSRRAVWEEVSTLRRAGSTVVLTTQHMEEADRLCDRVGIVDHGRLVAEGTTAALKAACGGDIVSVDFPGGVEDAQRAVRVLRQTAGVEEPVLVGASISAPVNDPLSTVAALCAALSTASIPVSTIRVSPPSLEDVYLHHTGFASREQTSTSRGLTSLAVAVGAPTGAQ